MLTTNEGEKYLSVNEVIGKYGLTRYRVSKIIHTQDIRVMKIKNKYYINDEDIRDYLKKVYFWGTIFPGIIIIFIGLLFLCNC
ncbi:MAG: DNA-binding protein [Coprobacillus sp.]|nr:DNA-binding protein [Coprobacillus sp.]MDY4145964.1 DNA-binding protein [Bacilli bacterium]CCY07097.1 unknown [Coprobacillus sp. CAG:698]